MFDTALLMAFLPTIFFVSFTPGLCMTLAMTLGMQLGIRKTLWMMYGELLGLATVALSAALGVASVMLFYPSIFQVFKLLGAMFLIYMAWKMWTSPARLNWQDNKQTMVKRSNLFAQGYITAIANPKGWVFMVSLLPQFINVEKPLAFQLVGLIGIMTLTEFSCMFIYASGGKGLRVFLNNANNVQWLNRIAAGIMFIIAAWLFIGS